MLVLTSDRGFCGGFNSNVLREAQSLQACWPSRASRPVPYVVRPQGHQLVPVPRPGARRGVGRLLRHAAHANAAEITAALLEAFEQPAEEGGVDEIHVVYNRVRLDADPASR